MGRPAIYIRIIATSEKVSADIVVTQSKSVTVLRRIRRTHLKYKDMYSCYNHTLSITCQNLSRHSKRPSIN